MRVKPGDAFRPRASRPQKRPAAEFIDPLANKKPRISHLASKATGPVNGKLSSANGKEVGGISLIGGDSVTASSQLPLLEIPRPFDPLSDVSNDSSHNGRDCEGQEVAVAERLGQPPAPAASAAAPQPAHGSSPFRPSPLGLSGPPEEAAAASHHGKSKKKSKKHKDKEKSREREKGADEHGLPTAGSTRSPQDCAPHGTSAGS